MPTKTIPLSRLETNLRATLNECADSGQALVVELPDQRRLTIQRSSEDNSSSPAGQRFYGLAEKWKRETLYVSNVTKKVMHPDYQSIIGLGEPAIPLLLRELKKDPA